MADITACMESYIANEELSGAALMVRKEGVLVYQEKWGYSKIEKKIPIEYDSIFRMMSMTKCVTAVAVLQLVEQGKIELDDPVEKYLPELKGMPVSADERYRYDPKKLWKLLVYKFFFRLDRVKTEPAIRPFTIRDLLSHSSGLEQGIVGLLTIMKAKGEDETLEQRINHYYEYILGFQPGTDTGYSPCAGFDVLGYLVTIISGKTFEKYIEENICTPLGMKDTTFFLDSEQKKRLVDVYKRKDGKLVNVTGTKEDMYGILHQKPMTYEQGCGGLFSTLIDYEHFADMLCNNGTYRGRQILKPETVELMRTEAAKIHLEPDPGMVWGLGVKIRQNPRKAKSAATEGTYGWSGAFGTHFFVSPEDHLEAVFVTNRSDIGGSGSYISQKVEEMVFDQWGNGK